MRYPSVYSNSKLSFVSQARRSLKYLTDRRAVFWYLIERPKIFIPKTREMMTSWLVCG